MDDKKDLVQCEIKKLKNAALALSIFAILTTFGNVISIYNYNQLINREKICLKQINSLISEIQIRLHLGG